MLNLIIDENRCIQCGECAADCPVMLFDMSQGIPFIPEHRQERCIQCQHCLAICPTGALSILGFDPENSEEINFPQADLMANLIKGRRSVRRYRSEAVPSTTLDHLMDIVAYAPTGQNRALVRFTLIDDPTVMEQVRKVTYDGIRLAIKENVLPDRLKFFVNFLRAYDQGRDIIYRFAPHMILASAPATSASPEADPFIALSYFELMAQSMGLGTLWCGYARWAIEAIVPQLGQDLGIPADHKVMYALMFGFPDVTYSRTVQRKIQNVHRVRLEDVQG